MAAHDHETFARLTSRKESQVGRLRLATLISGVYLCLEVVGGILSNSLALLADAGHMLVDVAALSVAYLAARLASLPPSPRRTWGLLRAEVIGAFVNGAALVIMVGFIVMRAVQRLSDPPHIRGPLMVAVALGGLAANVASAAVLFRARNESINLRGAFAHVVADALGSIGAMLAGVVISATGWVAADALASMGIGGLVLYSGLGIVRESLDILMQATPRGIDFEEVREALAGLEFIRAACGRVASRLAHPIAPHQHRTRAETQLHRRGQYHLEAAARPSQTRSHRMGQSAKVFFPVVSRRKGRVVTHLDRCVAQ